MRTLDVPSCVRTSENRRAVGGKSNSAPPIPIITGWGLISPLGFTANETWTALLAGEAIETHAPLAVDGPAYRPRVTRLALQAAREAMSSQNDWELASTALIVGTSKGPVESWMNSAGASAGRVELTGIADLASELARELNLGGARLTVSAACASGLIALIRAALMIQSHQVQRVLVVAAEASVHPLFLATFERLGVLPKPGERCRPFDRHRSGFLMSEAAAAVCLESSNLVADQQGEPPNRYTIAVDRFAMGGDATHLTHSDPSASALRHLLRHVVNGQEFDLVHAHGTGTVVNDEMELREIDSLLPDSPTPASLYSHKGALGHTLGAAGLVSIVLNCLAHQHNLVPPNIATRAPLPAKHLSISPNKTERRIDRSLALAAGFGGPMAMASLISV